MNKTSNPIQHKAGNLPRADWPVMVLLIALSAVPFAAGLARLVDLSSSSKITPENVRFFAAPLPVVLHILTASLFCILGAFQFAPNFRRRHPFWHRIAGRVLVACGLIAAISGLWMTQFYALHPLQLQGDLLYGFRLFIGSVMAMSLVFSLAAILRRDLAQHRAWMIRGYAIAQGAGTQVLVFLPWEIIFGKPNEQTRDILMIAAWVINLAVAEWVIRNPSISFKNKKITDFTLPPSRVGQ